jgi:hypothetical protein
MDEYADCIQYLLDTTDPARARAQKEFEERIDVPFSLRPRDPNLKLETWNLKLRSPGDS